MAAHPWSDSVFGNRLLDVTLDVLGVLLVQSTSKQRTVKLGDWRNWRDRASAEPLDVGRALGISLTIAVGVSIEWFGRSADQNLKNQIDPKIVL